MEEAAGKAWRNGGFRHRYRKFGTLVELGLKRAAVVCAFTCKMYPNVSQPMDLGFYRTPLRFPLRSDAP